MIKTTVLIFSFLLPIMSLSQQMSPSKEKSSKSESAEFSFQDYCEQEALDYIKVPEEKLNGINLSGELQSLIGKPNSNFIDYGIDLKENETLYFSLVGSDKILVAKSLYVLRLNYNKHKK